MKNKLIIILTVLTLFSCKRKQIIADGYIVDEKTGAHFNPYTNAVVRLFDKNGGNSREIGSASVDANGYYQISGTNKINLDGSLQLSKDNGTLVSALNVTITNKMHNDFVIPCSSYLNRVFKSLSFIPFDSIFVTVNNSSGTTTLKNYNPFTTVEFYYISLKAEENNFLTSSMYINGIVTQRLDTINKGCRSVVRDTVKI